MSRRSRMMLGLGAAGLGVGMLFVTGPRTGRADDRPEPQVSPSGKRVLVVVEGRCASCGPFRQFNVMDREDRTLYASTDHFRTRDTTWFGWGDGDRVWVYSGDVGTFYWEPLKNGKWQKGAYSDGRYPAPEALKRFRPKLFPR